MGQSSVASCTKALRPALLSTLLVSLLGCTTQIKDRNETILPSAQPFGSFPVIVMAPLAVEHMEGDSGDQNAVREIQSSLSTCMAGVFPGIRQMESTEASGASGRMLLIEPAVVDLKKVNSAERVFAGALAGSSAALLRMRFTDTGTGKVIAEPIFYSKAAAMGGAWTFGATDNAMLSRLTDQACEYSRKNM